MLWVIVNDGGQPEPVDVIARQARERRLRTQVVHLDRFGGWQAANAGTAESRSEYLVRLDDDDTWAPGLLRQTLALMDAHPVFAGVVTGARRGWGG